MKTLIFKISIQAKPEEVWGSLWNKENYTKWTKPFTEGCYYEVESFSEGNEIKFLSLSGDGMLSKIITLKPQEYVAFEHLSMVMNGQEVSFKPEGDKHNYVESYELSEDENSTTLTVKVDTLEAWEEIMSSSFPQALQVVKELSEL